jgi:hypothetical protein
VRGCHEVGYSAASQVGCVVSHNICCAATMAASEQQYLTCYSFK